MEGSVTVGPKVQKDVKPMSRLLAMKNRLHQQRNSRPKDGAESDSKPPDEKAKESESKQTKVRHCESDSKLKAKEMYKYKSNGSLPQNGSVNPLSKVPKSHTFESGLDRGAGSRKSKISRIFKSRSVEMKLGTESKVGVAKRTPRSKTTEVRIEDLPAGGATVPKMNGYGTFTKLASANGRTKTPAGKPVNGGIHTPKNVPNMKCGGSSESLKLPVKQVTKPAYQGSLHRQDIRSQTAKRTPGKTDSKPCVELKQDAKTYQYSRVLNTDGATVPGEQFRKRTSSDGYAVKYIKREISTNMSSVAHAVACSSTGDTNANQPPNRLEDVLQVSGVSDDGGFRPRPSKNVTAKDVGTAENERHKRAPLKLTQALEGQDRQPDRTRTTEGE